MPRFLKFSSFCVLFVLCVPFISSESCFIIFGVVNKNCRAGIEETVARAPTVTSEAEARQLNCTVLYDLIDCLDRSLYLFNDCPVLQPAFTDLLNESRHELNDMCKQPEYLLCNHEIDPNCGRQAGSSLNACPCWFVLIIAFLPLAFRHHLPPLNRALISAWYDASSNS